MSTCNRPLQPVVTAIALAIAVFWQTSDAANGQDLGLGLLTANTAPTGPRLPALPPWTFSEVNPAKILVIGDSLGFGMGITLRERALELGLNAEVVNRARSSTGLSRKDFFDWPEAFRSLAALEDPDIVVAHFGANDMQSVIRPNERVILGTPEWDVAYREEIRNILNVAGEANAMLYWLGPGPDLNPSLNRHLAHINPLFKSEAEAHGAIYLPIAEFAATPEGGYLRSADIDGRTVRIRTDDGSHFTGSGYALVVDRLLNEMERRVPSVFGERENLLAVLQ